MSKTAIRKLQTRDICGSAFGFGVVLTTLVVMDPRVSQKFSRAFYPSPTEKLLSMGERLVDLGSVVRGSARSEDRQRPMLVLTVVGDPARRVHGEDVGAHVLALEPDPTQAAALKLVVRDRVGAEFVVAESKDAALAAIRDGAGLILLTALISPRDETEIADLTGSSKAPSTHRR